MDFTGILSVFDSFIIVAAISAIAAIKILPGVACWGFSKVIAWFSVGISDPVHHKSGEVKKRSTEARSSSHPVISPVESNLEPESRFKIFGVIFGFFSGFFTKFFSFFRRKPYLNGND